MTEKDDEYQLVFPAQIGTIDGDIPQDIADDDGLPIRWTNHYVASCADFLFSAEALRKRELTSLENAEQSISNINFGVSDEIQTLYDRLSFL